MQNDASQYNDSMERGILHINTGCDVPYISFVVENTVVSRAEVWTGLQLTSRIWGPKCNVREIFFRDLMQTRRRYEWMQKLVVLREWCLFFHSNLFCSIKICKYCLYIFYEGRLKSCCSDMKLRSNNLLQTCWLAVVSHYHRNDLTKLRAQHQMFRMIYGTPLGVQFFVPLQRSYNTYQ